MLKIVAGVFMCLLSLWGGSYIMYEIAVEWVKFPSLITAVYGFVGGMALVINNLT